MAKEIGMKGAPKKAKAEDKKIDKKLGLVEGSKADLAQDRMTKKKYPAKKKAKKGY